MPDIKTLIIAGESQNIQFDVTPPFSASGDGAVPTDCVTIIENAKADTTASVFLDRYKIGSTTSLTQKLNDLKNALPIDNSKEITNNAALIAVTDYLKKLTTTHIPVIQHVTNCLRESLQIDNTKIKEAQAMLDEAKSRLASITNPEENVSYYEGWFPLVRPMSESALFGLFGAAILLLLLSIMISLRLTGVEIDIKIPEIMIPYFTLPPNASYYIYGGIAVGLLGGISYAYYTSKYRK
jgi:hypothetical protein